MHGDYGGDERMCFFFSLMPATFWAIVGYFILFSSTSAEGTVRTLGQLLAVWTFIIAGFIFFGRCLHNAQRHVFNRWFVLHDWFVFD